MTHVWHELMNGMMMQVVPFHLHDMILVNVNDNVNDVSTLSDNSRNVGDHRVNHVSYRNPVIL